MRNIICGSLSLVALGLAAATPDGAVAPARHTITHEDVWLAPRLSAPVPSPDGSWVIIPVVQPAYEAAQQQTDLWIVPADGSAPVKRLTSSKRPKAGLEWSPDGTRIAFSMKEEKGERAQIHVINLADGKSTQVTHLALGAYGPRWSPDGRSLLFVSPVYPGALSDDDNRRASDEEHARKYSARVYDSYPPRFWNHWLDATRLHPFVLSLEPGAVARDLLAGSRLAAQRGFSGGFAGDESALETAWTPDGAAVVFAATEHADLVERQRVPLNLYLVALKGGEPRQLTAGPATYSKPAFSRDGRWLVCTYNEESPDEVYDISRLVRFEWPSMGGRTVLTAGLDRSVGGFSINERTGRGYFTYEDAGLERLHSVGISDGLIRDEPCPTEGVCSGVRACGPGAVGIWESAVSPPEAYLFVPGGWRRLTDFSGAAADAIDWLPPEHFWFTARDGMRIHSMLIKPPGFEPTRKYPLFVVIHGGPASMWKDQFFVRWNYHLLASSGLVVLLTDYKGSTGYGEAFSRSIKHDPLRGPADEVNEAADYAVAHYPFIDGARQVAAGASYGGHLANWLEATTTRYKAIVSHAGEADLAMQWGTSDGNYDREVSSGGPFWGNSPIWRDQSPVMQAANHENGTGFRTPILITVGERDFRVPLNNALMFFALQQRLGVPSRLIVFPEANHHIVRGEDSRFWYAQLQGWVTQWLAP